MPTYEYACQNCHEQFEETRSIHEKGPDKCPICGTLYGQGFDQNYSGYNQISLVYGSPTTIGQQAELNAKRLGKEQMQLLVEKEKARKFGGKLPQGASLPKEEAETPWFRSGEVPGLPKRDKLDLAKIKNTEKFIETGETT